jgi:acyl dehydratase
VAYEPKGRYWDDFKVGETFETAARTVEAGDVGLFAGRCAWATPCTRP